MLSAVENRNIEVIGGLSDNGGMAAFEIESVSVSGVPIDKGLISPFIEEDDFSELFSVEYDSVEVDDGLLVFKNGAGYSQVLKKQLILPSAMIYCYK